MDHAGRAELLQNAERLARTAGRVVGQPDVKRLALSYQQIQGGHGFFQRRIRIRSMVIEDIHVFQPHTLQALIQAGDQVLFRAPIPIRPGPHGVTGL
ncbi:hypothetical protein D3C87_1927410 [compost metagenome]